MEYEAMVHMRNLGNALSGVEGDDLVGAFAEILHHLALLSEPEGESYEEELVDALRRLGFSVTR